MLISCPWESGQCVQKISAHHFLQHPFFSVDDALSISTVGAAGSTAAACLCVCEMVSVVCARAIHTRARTNNIAVVDHLLVPLTSLLWQLPLPWKRCPRSSHPWLTFPRIAPQSWSTHERSNYSFSSMHGHIGGEWCLLLCKSLRLFRGDAAHVCEVTFVAHH